ncbi:MAG: hypothetical protein R3E95_18460 [Thiolinea sp.]
MLDHNNNNNDSDFEHDDDFILPEEKQSKSKPHIIRRNLEDYLEQRALEKRLKDVFDDDFLID